MAKAVRLDKFLADAGKGTRSEVKKFIQKGQVQVNGVPAKKPEMKVDPENDVVVLSGETVGAAPELSLIHISEPTRLRRQNIFCSRGGKAYGGKYS